MSLVHCKPSVGISNNGTYDSCDSKRPTEKEDVAPCVPSLGSYDLGSVNTVDTICDMEKRRLEAPSVVGCKETIHKEVSTHTVSCVDC